MAAVNRLSSILDKATDGAKVAGGVGKNILSRSWDNIASVGFKGQAEYIESALVGAIAGASVGGVTEWAQGGSFFNGAANGALPGAALGFGYKAAKVGAVGSDWKNAKVGDVIGAYRSGVSKQVQALNMNKVNQQKAKTVMQAKRK